MVEETVRRFYAGFVRDEWKRPFASPYRRLEFDTTFYFLDKYLPKSGLILDAGGGPGRYTIALAKRGYDVLLLDPVVENLRFAKNQIRRAKVQSKVRDVLEGSIEDLSPFADNTFDAVLCTGAPLSHILNAKTRERAVGELIRVAKRKAVIFTSVIARLSALVLELNNGFKYTGPELFRRLRDTGDFPGETVFTPFHSFLPNELREVFERQGTVKVLEMAGLQGIGSTHAEKVNELAKNHRLWKVWLETHYKVCTEPSIIGMSEHILIVARKR